MLSYILPEAFYKWFRKFSAPLPEDINRYLTTEKSILDVGAGNGFFLGQITATKKRFATEVWDKQIAYLKKHFPDVPVYTSDEAVDRTFDVVTCFDVLHHIEDNTRRDRFLATLYRIVTPGGILIIKDMRDDLPLHKWFNRLSDFLSTRSHTNEMNPELLVELLKKHGFTVERFEKYTALLYGHYYIAARKS
jgi:2-polyprenyl-3-methyl-5-hydroxy-6-metoxy-1,4-benzoquinol methylase